MTPANTSCITLDYLEIYCHRNSLIIGCRSEDGEIWVSELGPEPSDLTQAEIQRVLRESRIFEIRKRDSGEEGDDPFVDSSILTRPEMEACLRGLLN